MSHLTLLSPPRLGNALTERSQRDISSLLMFPGWYW